MQFGTNLCLLQYIRSMCCARFRFGIGKRFRVDQIQRTQSHCFHRPGRSTDIAGMAGVTEYDANVIEWTEQGHIKIAYVYD